LDQIVLLGLMVCFPSQKIILSGSSSCGMNLVHRALNTKI
jgi:hypothetical protein